MVHFQGPLEVLKLYRLSLQFLEEVEPVLLFVASAHRWSNWEHPDDVEIFRKRTLLIDGGSFDFLWSRIVTRLLIRCKALNELFLHLACDSCGHPFLKLLDEVQLVDRVGEFNTAISRLIFQEFGVSILSFKSQLLESFNQWSFFIDCGWVLHWCSNIAKAIFIASKLHRLLPLHFRMYS